MDDALQARFEAAAEEAQRLPERPDNATLLRLYALYKQATADDVAGRRPGFTDFAGRTKHDAWADLAGTDRADAARQYADLVDGLKA